MRLLNLDYKKWAYITVCAFGALALFYISFRFLLPIALPFLIAWAIAFPVRQAAYFLHRKIKIPIRAACLALTVLSVAGIFLLLFLLVRRLAIELNGLFTYLSQNPDILADMFADVKGFLYSIASHLPFGDGADGTLIRVEEYLEAFVSEGVAAIASYLPRLIGGIVVGLPSIIFFIVVTVISAFYFCIDLSNINSRLLSGLPPRVRTALSSFKRGVFNTALRYLRAYLSLMLLVCLLLLVGFLILGIEYALLLAVIFALVDILPVLGVGILLIPWGLFCLITGNPALGIGLLVLYAVVAIVRQYAEPRIIGKHFGIHPLVTLISMYAGVRLLGFFGVIFGPVAVVLIKGAIKPTRAEVETKPPQNQSASTNKILPKS